MSELTQLNVWLALMEHYDEIKHAHMRDSGLRKMAVPHRK